MSDRTEASGHAMQWARTAQSVDDQRREAIETWNRQCAVAHWTPGGAAAHDERLDALSRLRERAIRMASMWAQVAAVQDPE